MSSNPSNDAEEDPSKKTQETFSPPATTNIDNDNDNDNAPIDKPYLTIAEKEVVGIGGKQGYTYDVNKLKNNLVQKSVRQFKQDLHLLLLNISPPNNPKAEAKRRFQIEEKLAALVSANPVATTTDSNLLEGTWELAFVSNNAKEILDEARFIYSRKSESVKNLKTGEGNWKLSSNSASGKWENPLHTWKRTIFLEALDDDEDPFMIDTVSLFRGLWTVQRFYDVTGLTRTSLELVPSSKVISLCGRHLVKSRAEAEDSTILTLQFIYLDSDICVCMTGGNKDNLQVYTKNEDWIESRKQRKHMVKAILSWLNSFESPLRLRRKLFSLLGNDEEDEETGGMGKLSEENFEIMLRRVYDDEESKLVALRLGDYGSSQKDDDTAWGGKDDPFVHLSADERQCIMKQMSIGEIKKAGYIQQKFAKRFKRRRSDTQVFRRPSFEKEERVD